MTSAAAETLDEAYERLSSTGPEFDGWLSNHGPMVAEAMVPARPWRSGELLAGRVHAPP